MQEDDVPPPPPPRGSSLSKEQKQTAQTVKTIDVSQNKVSQAEMRPTFKPRTRFRTRLEERIDDGNRRIKQVDISRMIDGHQEDSIPSREHKKPPPVKAKPQKTTPATSRIATSETVTTATNSALPMPIKGAHKTDSGPLSRKATVKSDSRGYNVDRHSDFDKSSSLPDLSEQNREEDLYLTPKFHDKINDLAGFQPNYAEKIGAGSLNRQTTVRKDSKGYVKMDEPIKLDEPIKGPRQMNSYSTDPGIHKPLTATVSSPCDFKEQGSDNYFEVKSLPGTNADRVNDISIPTPPNPSQMEEWTVNDVANHLVHIKLGKYAEAFKQKQVDGSLFLVLNEDILRQDFGIKSRLEIKKLLLSQKGWTPKTG